MPMQGWTDGHTKAAPSASELEGTLLSNWEKRERGDGKNRASGRAGGSQFPRVIDSQTGTDQSLSLVLRRRRQNNLLVSRVDSHWTNWVTRTQNLQVLVSLLQRTTLVCFAAKEWIRQLLKCVASPSAVMDFTCVTE